MYINQDWRRLMFLIEYIKKYKVTYISVIIAFIIGAIIGIFVTFKIPKSDKQNVKSYINNTIEIAKAKKIDKQYLFKQKLIENFKTLGIIWLLGCTIIASFTIYIFMVYKGILFGYIITIILVVLGFEKGFMFLLWTVIIKSLIFLPIIFLLSTSGIRLYKEIIKRKINIKQELLKHTIIMLISCVFAIIISCIDSYFLTGLLYFL